MSLRYRYIFHSHAAAFGGHIVRPKDVVLEAKGASALLVTGGRSVSKLSRTAYGKFFEVRSASTFAEGLFNNRRRHVDVTLQKADEQSLTALTRVHAEVLGLAVGRRPRLTIRRLRAELHGQSPNAGGQPKIKVGRDVAVEGVAIDGRRLIVELNVNPFRTFDTHSKLMSAADDPAFVRRAGRALLMQKDFAGHPAAPPAGRLLEHRGTIYATIVRRIAWQDEPFPGSSIDHNMVVIPGLGRLYFGELLISSDSRRLTMVRMALGSDAGGMASAADVQDNGGWGWTP